MKNYHIKENKFIKVIMNATASNAMTAIFFRSAFLLAMGVFSIEVRIRKKDIIEMMPNK
jgi:hypothetical protein